jgi:lysophospholipase L1-like esterase
LKTLKRTLILTLYTLCVSAAFTEIGARILVRIRYDPERLESLTTASDYRDKYAKHPVLPYVLRASVKDHNSRGWRGPEFLVPKPPGVFRIVCVGGSSTYGTKTSHVRFLDEQLRAAGHDVEVLNAGAPGWTSRESLVNFELRVLATQPDLVIVYHGRNDLFPQAYDNFEMDHAHFRDWSYDFTESNRDLKRWFRWSRAIMILALGFPPLSGWDFVAEHPIYGSLRVENRPPPERAVQNLNEPERTEGFRRNNEQLINLASEQGAAVVLATFAFVPSKLRTWPFLYEDWVLIKPLRKQLNRNNDVLRELAAKEPGVYLAETAKLAARKHVFFDDCHVTKEGHRLRAKMLLEALERHDLLPSG